MREVEMGAELGGIWGELTNQILVLLGINARKREGLITCETKGTRIVRTSIWRCCGPEISVWNTQNLWNYLWRWAGAQARSWPGENPHTFLVMATCHDCVPDLLWGLERQEVLSKRRQHYSAADR